MLNNKLILITGGSSGIGKAAATLLVQQGAKVLLQARTESKLEEAAKAMDPTGKQVAWVSTDLTDLDSVTSSAASIVETHGVPDVIINSAGSGEWLSLAESTAEHYLETIQSPYLATAYTCKVFFDYMQERGTGQFIIVNSVACYVPIPGAIGYATSRSAMQGFANSMQADLHHTKFKVSLITLGKVDSPYFTNNPISEQRIPKAVGWFVSTMTETAAGKEVVKLVHRPKEIVVKPVMMNVLVFLNRFFPGAFKWIMRTTGYKAPNQRNR